MKNYFSTVIVLLLLLACQSPEEDLLSGSWRGSVILENGDSLEIDPSHIRLVLHPGGTYEYESTLNIQEAGAFHVQQPYLYTRDTLNEASAEKAVEIILLSADSLHLRMNDAGKERLLKMTRE